MLSITIPEKELWDKKNEEFFWTKKHTLQLEHSLVSISKWESKWHKAYLTKKEKTTEEILDYIRCMTITQNVPNYIYGCLTQENISEIADYINDPMTATSFPNAEPGAANPNREVMTSEIIYYRMVALNIPFECQKWHIRRLLTLIEVCNRKNQPRKKMSRSSILSRNASLNAARRQQMNTKG